GRAQDDVARADRCQLGGDVAAIGLRGGGEARTQLGAARVDAELPTGLRVDEPQLAGVRQLLLAGIADLDGDHLMAAGELEQRLAPVTRSSEVGDEDDERALPSDCVGAAKGGAERRGADPSPRRFRLVAEGG